MYEENPNKEKRIAFLSVFSSIARTGAIDTKTASEVVDSLFKKYPLEEVKRTTSVPRAYQPEQISGDKCPDCGGVLKEKSGIKNGRKWSGQFCQNPECKKVIWLPKQTRDQTVKSMHNDADYEANQQENYNGEQGNHYDQN